MAATMFELNQLPPEFVKAINAATQASELVIVDNNVPVAHVVIVCPQPGARIPGLHPGSFLVGDDFDAPLRDRYWLGYNHASSADQRTSDA